MNENRGLVEGHEYVLQPYVENGEQPVPPQVVVFMKKENGVKVMDGTTNEAVLDMMIQRMNYLQGKFPCRENAIAITKLQEALMWLVQRTVDRTKRGVEGQDKA